MSIILAVNRYPLPVSRGFSCASMYRLLTGNDSTHVTMNKPICHINQYAYIQTTVDGVTYDRTNELALQAEVGLPLLTRQNNIGQWTRLLQTHKIYHD